MKHYDKIVKKAIFLMYYTFLFYSHSQKYQGLKKKRIFYVGILIPYEGAHLVKTSNPALLGILFQLVQNSSVKHPIWKINLFQNPSFRQAHLGSGKIIYTLWHNFPRAMVSHGPSNLYSDLAYWADSVKKYTNSFTSNRIILIHNKNYNISGNFSQ